VSLYFSAKARGAVDFSPLKEKREKKKRKGKRKAVDKCTA